MNRAIVAAIQRPTDRARCLQELFRGRNTARARAGAHYLGLVLGSFVKPK